MTRRPAIGVTASARSGRIMWLFNRWAVWRAGGTACRIAADDPCPADSLDGLIVGGGDDISAELYGGELEVGVRIDPERDQLEMRYLESAIQRGIPILGVCRGSQILNVFRGGTLHHDIYKVYKGVKHRRTPLPRLRITIEPGTRLLDILRQLNCCVNALHHQAIDRPGEGMRIVAHDQDGIVQATEAESGTLCLGVQWHPEFLIFDRHQQNLFRTVVSQA